MVTVVARPDAAGEVPESGHRRRRGHRRLYEGLSALIGAAVGLAPHVLHHVGFLVGTAFVAGSGGTALFGSLGAVAALPLLRRLYKRFRTWRAPAMGAVIFSGMFAFSSLVIGPLVSGSSGGDKPAPTSPASPHQSHH